MADFNFTEYQLVKDTSKWKLEKQIEFPRCLRHVICVRNEKNQELYDRLLEAAERHVRTIGPKNLKMDDIARELGVSKKTIYKVVSGKEALIRGIVEGFVIELITKMRTLVESDALTFEAKVEAFFNLISLSLKRFDSRVFMELERYFPAVHTRVESIRREVLPEMLGKLVEQGQKSGEVREDLVISVFAEAFLQSVQGMFRADSMRVHGLEPHEIPVELSQLFIFGIRK